MEKIAIKGRHFHTRGYSGGSKARGGKAPTAEGNLRRTKSTQIDLENGIDTETNKQDREDRKHRNTESQQLRDGEWVQQDRSQPMLHYAVKTTSGSGGIAPGWGLRTPAARQPRPTALLVRPTRPLGPQGRPRTQATRAQSQGSVYEGMRSPIGG
jgi:hypothetical protein